VHDGSLRSFGGVFYWYGTAYACGFEWLVPGTPFCGFRSLSSPDLVHWTDRGLLFPVGAAWDRRCGGQIGGCFRPKVVFNAVTKRYVLWWNQPGAFEGRSYGVATSNSPTGPFQVVDTSPCCGGTSSGDEDVWTEKDAAYLAATVGDGSSDGHIVISRLDANFQRATDRRTTITFTGRAVEAPSLFQRKGTYYLTVSDPSCGYCSGTGTSYLTAPSPLGPWAFRGKISETSCRGQPAAVTSIGGGQYIYQTDRWKDTPNETAADQWWGLLKFGGNNIMPIDCTQDSFRVKVGP
jgi:beta-xylosidase